MFSTPYHPQANGQVVSTNKVLETILTKTIQRDEMPLQPQVLIEPFERWALNFVGPITPISKGKSYILVCINYVTKWIEAKALPKDTEQAVADFLYEDIFTRFDIPKEIVTDQGTQFTSKLI